MEINMFDLIRKLEESKPQVEVKVSIWGAIKNAIRSWKGKRKFQAVAKAKRAEKAQLAQSNSVKADELMRESDELVMKTIGMKDRVKVDELLEQAADKAFQAELLRNTF
jgi:hypothetical protein